MKTGASLISSLACLLLAGIAFAQSSSPPVSPAAFIKNTEFSGLLDRCKLTPEQQQKIVETVQARSRDIDALSVKQQEVRTKCHDDVFALLTPQQRADFNASYVIQGLEQAFKPLTFSAEQLAAIKTAIPIQCPDLPLDKDGGRSQAISRMKTYIEQHILTDEQLAERARQRRQVAETAMYESLESRYRPVKPTADQLAAIKAAIPAQTKDINLEKDNDRWQASLNLRAYVEKNILTEPQLSEFKKQRRDAFEASVYEAVEGRYKPLKLTPEQLAAVKTAIPIQCKDIQDTEGSWAGVTKMKDYVEKQVLTDAQLQTLNPTRPASKRN